MASQPAEGSDVALHEGDASVLAQLFDDVSYAHVLAELRRTGWLAAQREKLLRIADQVWGHALEAQRRRA